MADGAAPRSTPGGADRLSALDDDLLHEIISMYLPVTEAARTVVLSRRWRHLWSSSPLVLRDADLPEPARDALVPRVLAVHPGHFRSVRLADCRLASLDRELPGWPRLLADKLTQKLCLANRFTPNQPIVLPCLPADILRCGSLRELLLGFWVFPVDLSRGAVISLPLLRRLDLVMTMTSDEDLEYLIAACPALKTLKLTTPTTPTQVRLRSRSLQCALVGLCRVEEFTVVDAPLLERLVLFLPGNVVRVKIGYAAAAANLLVLGHLNTRLHRLQIGDNAIGPNTMASTDDTVIPSVKNLAVTVNFGVLWEVKMLASFLRCFSNIDTLHIESVLHVPSVTANEPSGEHHARFWQEVGPVECLDHTSRRGSSTNFIVTTGRMLGSHVKKMVIHNFQGDQNEFEFLKFIARNALELQSLHVVLQEENISSTEKVNETRDKLQCLQFESGISGVLLVLPEEGSLSRLQKATDLTFHDPFRF